MKKKRLKYLKIAGNILTLVAVVYIINEIYSSEIHIEYVFSLENAKYIFFAILSQCFIIACSSIPWRMLVQFLADKNLKKSEVSLVFLKANILKYLPGNFFHYIGRNQIALDYKLNHIDVFLATIIDTVVGLGVGVLFSLFFFGNLIFQYVKNIIVIIVVFIVFLLVTLFIIWKKKGHISKFVSVNGMKVLVEIFLYYCMQNAFTVIIVMFVGLCIGGSYDLRQLRLIACGYIFSSVIGTLTPGSPAGIGIRESVMVSICRDFVYEDILLLTIIMRLISTVGDFLTFLVAKVCLVVKEKKCNCGNKEEECN